MTHTHASNTHTKKHSAGCKICFDALPASPKRSMRPPSPSSSAARSAISAVCTDFLGVDVAQTSFVGRVWPSFRKKGGKTWHHSFCQPPSTTLPEKKRGKTWWYNQICWSGHKREQQRGATRERARFVQLLPPTKCGAPLTAGLLCHLSLQREQAFAPARSGFRGRCTFFGFHLVKTPRTKIQIFPVVTNSL